MHTLSWFFTVMLLVQSSVQNWLKLCLLVVYIGGNSPNRELSKRAQALGGSGVGSGRTNESFSAKNKLYWTRQNREGDRTHTCSTYYVPSCIQQSTYMYLVVYDWVHMCSLPYTTDRTAIPAVLFVAGPWTIPVRQCSAWTKFPCLGVKAKIAHTKMKGA